MNEETIADELAGTWALLDRPDSAQLRSSRTNLRVGGREVQVALDRVGARHLLLPHSDAPDDPTIWRNRMMSLMRSTLIGDDGHRHAWLVLRCKQADAEDAFVRLSAQIVHRVLQLTAGPISEATVSVLNQWQDLFGAGSSTEESLTGLIGELLVLERIATKNPRGAWQAWEGPKGGRHDFRFGPTALEVKSTLHPTAGIVTINGLAQLVPPSQGTLHLLFTRLERVPGGSITLSRLLARLTELGLSRSAVVEALIDVGHDPDRAAAAFELRETRLYSVDEKFPRIVQESFVDGVVPPGVQNVAYSINLGQAVPLPDGSFDPLLGKLAGS